MAPSNQVRHLRERRYARLAGLVVAGLAAVAAGLLYLQVVQHDKYRALSQENRVRVEVLRAPRGAIYDRNGVLLADSRPSFRVVFRPFPAESAQRARETLTPDWYARVARLIRQDSSQVREQVSGANRGGRIVVLRPNAPFEVVAAVEESRGELPGLEVQVEPLRHYPNGPLAAHLLGYAGEINEVELERLQADGYRPGDLIGRTGVERTYEQHLRGQDGAEFVVVNAVGKRVATLTERPPRPPVPGHDLVLTLDLKVQKALEEAMADVKRGAAVAIDPRDGGILGLVSRPAFDPNEFSEGLSFARWDQISGGGSNPLLNRAIQGVYPPASTFKIVSMLAALRAEIATPGRRLSPCGGHWTFAGRAFACWRRSGHGSLTFIEALQFSCDVYFYQLAPLLGLPRLEETARELGFGERTGVDLPQESRGLMPSLGWYERRRSGRFRPSLLLNLVIGQGEILATPLQMALMAAEVGNNGRPLRPHVVRQVVGELELRRPRASHPGLSVAPAVWQAVHQGLERTVAEGTGTAARVPGVRVAGKTGTAQNPHGEDHALFVCSAPAVDPTIALAFVIENSGHGGSVAAPRAGHVLRRLFLPDSLQSPGPRILRPDTSGVVRGD